jgi:hypothetical protein
MTSRFQEPNHKLAPKFCTYTLDGEGQGYNFCIPRACAAFVAVIENEKTWVSHIEFDLAHNDDGEVEIARNGIRVYAPESPLPIKSSAYYVAAKGLLDDKAEWERACQYLNDNGDLIECERAAA